MKLALQSSAHHPCRIPVVRPRIASHRPWKQLTGSCRNTCLKLLRRLRISSSMVRRPFPAYLGARFCLRRCSSSDFPAVPQDATAVRLIRALYGLPEGFLVLTLSQADSALVLQQSQPKSCFREIPGFRKPSYNECVHFDDAERCSVSLIARRCSVKTWGQVAEKTFLGQSECGADRINPGSRCWQLPASAFNQKSSCHDNVAHGKDGLEKITVRACLLLVCHEVHHRT